MFTITLPPVLEDAAAGRSLASTLPDDGAAHVEIDATLLALADHAFVDELMDELMARGLQVLVVDGAPSELRGSFLDAAQRHRFDEIWFATDTAASE